MTTSTATAARCERYSGGAINSATNGSSSGSPESQTREENRQRIVCTLTAESSGAAETGASVAIGDSPAEKNRSEARYSGLTIFAIDPGTVQSGWVLYRSGQVVDSGVHDNAYLLRWIQAGQHADVLAIEMIAGMGMTVGQTTFDTVRWIGRFQQAWKDPNAVRFVYRRTVKLELCGDSRAKDRNIRQALIDRLGPPGVKARPGHTYGVKSHAWQALAVAVTVEAMRNGW